MHRIAVAGGMGQVGKSLVAGLANHGHTVIVLSRSASHEIRPDVTVLEANYDNPNATSKLLEENKIDTLVCAIGVLSAERNQSQLNLIKAAADSAYTTRFVISSYDMEYLRDDINPLAKYTFEAVDALRQTDLEHTRIVNGWFLDYYGMPHWKTTLHPWINIINMEEKWAAIPGDGSSQATYITTQDLGRFFARLMDEPKWQEVSSVVGNETKFTDLVKLAEKIRGCEFRKSFDSLEKLKSGTISFADRFPKAGLGSPAQDEAFFAIIHYMAGSGAFVVRPGKLNLNQRYPDIKLTTCEEVMEASWKGR
ncbi:hypothetical protein Q7P37_010359 [Cladosporium fusiforme]